MVELLCLMVTLCLKFLIFFGDCFCGNQDVGDFDFFIISSFEFFMRQARFCIQGKKKTKSKKHLVLRLVSNITNKRNRAL